MAEIENASAKQKKTGTGKTKRLSTRVDLTPMVDLGFLLITFFIFTTSLSKPVAMRLIVPDDEVVEHRNQVSAEKTITVLLGGDNKVFYYEGFFGAKVNEISYSALRSIIMNKKLEVIKRFHKNDLSILIKPCSQATYKNLIDCLDEMTINDIKTYVLDEPTGQELLSVKKIEI